MAGQLHILHKDADDKLIFEWRELYYYKDFKTVACFKLFVTSKNK